MSEMELRNHSTRLACKAVVFDLFGTLVSHYSLSSNERFLTELGLLLGVARDDLVRVWEATGADGLTGKFKTLEEEMRYVCGSLGVEASSDLIGNAGDLWLDLIRELLTPRRNALKILTYLQQERFSLGLISVCGPDTPSCGRNRLFVSTSQAPYSHVRWESTSPTSASTTSAVDDWVWRAMSAYTWVAAQTVS